MTGPINLNKARKARDKAEARAQAAANRVKFGRGKGAKTAEAMARDAAENRLDLARLAHPSPPFSGGEDG